jgi:hypothetical protein
MFVRERSVADPRKHQSPILVAILAANLCALGFSCSCSAEEPFGSSGSAPAISGAPSVVSAGIGALVPMQPRAEDSTNSINPADSSEFKVSGAGDDIEFHVNNSSIRRAIEKLAATFDFAFHSDKALDEKVDGAYNGSIESILAELLKNENYLSSVSNSKLLVEVLSDTSTNRSVVAATPAAKVRPPLPAAVVLAPTDRKQLIKRLFGDENRTVAIDDRYLAAYANRQLRGNDGHGGRNH